MDLGIVFIAGLTLGGLSCSLIQIGLFSSGVTYVSQPKKMYWDVFSFLVTRVVVAMLLGLGLGFLGTSFLIPDSFKLFFQLLAGLIMVITALSFVNINLPEVKGVSILWKNISKVVFNLINKHSYFSPILLGIISLFIPCGAMLAVESAALVTGNPFQSAILLGVFVLGTIPAFLGISFLSSIIRSKFRRVFYLLLGLFLFIFGLLTINGVLVLANSPITLQKLYEYSPIQINTENEFLTGVINDEGKRVIIIDVYPEGYMPTNITVGVGEQVQLILQTHGIYNCSSMFKIPAQDISVQLPPDGTQIVEFNADKVGAMQFSCATGLKTGIIQVI
jgi:sulfite exporter TauE/SafE